MNLITGEVVDIYDDTWKKMAKVRINGIYIRVPLMLLPEAKLGDHVLVDGGVAIAIVTARQKEVL